MKTPSFHALTRGPVLVALIMLPVVGQAAGRIWNGSFSSDWADAANWGGSTPISGDSLAFTSVIGVGGLELNNNIGTTNFDDIIFNPGAGAYVLTGNAITLGNASPTIVNRSSEVQTMNFNMALGANSTISGFSGINLGGLTTLNAFNLTNNLSGGKSLTLSGGVNISPDTTSKSAVFSGSGVTRITSVIADSGTGGAAASNITYNGSGTLELTAANTYSGLTRLQNGTLTVSNVAALQNSHLQVDGQSSGVPVLNLLSDADTTFATTGTNLLNNGANTVMTINVDPLTAGSSKILTLSNLSTNGGGQVNVTSGNGYTLAVTTLAVSGASPTLNPTTGNLAIGSITGNQTILLGGTSTGNTVGVISTNAIKKVGSGTWTLTGANTYTGNGSTRISAGTLIVDMSQGGSISNVGNAGYSFAVDGGNFVLKGASSGLSSQLFNGMQMNSGRSGASSITVDANGGSGTVLDMIAGANAGIFRSSGTIDFVLPTGTQSATNGITTTQGTTNGLLNSAYQPTAYATVNNGAAWAGKSGNNIVAYTHTGGETIAATGSTITNTSSANFLLNSAGAGGNVALAAATTTIYTLTQNSTSAAVVDTAGKTLKLSGILVTPTAAGLTIGANVGDGILDSPTTELVLINNSAASLVINSAIGAGGSFALTKSGTGTVVLANTVNAYTGTTFLNAGVLNIAADTSLGTAPVSVQNKLIFNGGTLQLAGSLNLATNRGILIAENGGTIDTNGFNSAYAGLIYGTDQFGGLTKTGSGTLSLSGAQQSNFTGTTTVSGGTLAYGASNIIYTGDVTVTGSSSVLDLGANQTDSVGVITVANGGSITGTGTSALTSTRGFEFKGGAVSAILAGGSQVAANKTTSGTVTLSGANTYTGQTFVKEGTLLVNGAHSGAGNYLVSSGARLGGTGSITFAPGGALSVAGTLGGGAGPATLDISGDLVFQSGSTLEINLGGTSPGDIAGAYGQVNMTFATGVVSLENNVNLSLAATGGFTPGSSDVFYILTRADADSNAFSQLFAGTTEAGVVSISGGFVGQITYVADWNGTQGASFLTGGNDIAIYNITSAAVPEPASVALIMGGLAGASLLVRRRRKQAMC